MENQKLYAVMVEGKQTPSKFHDNYADAETEAKRLANNERKTTYILLAVTKLELNDIKITPLNA